MLCAACGRAYSGQAVMTASRACQTGCKLELPAVENRFRQVSSHEILSSIHNALEFTLVSALLTLIFSLL